MDWHCKMILDPLLCPCDWHISKNLARDYPKWKSQCPMWPLKKSHCRDHINVMHSSVGGLWWGCQEGKTSWQTPLTAPTPCPPRIMKCFSSSPVPVPPSILLRMSTTSRYHAGVFVNARQERRLIVPLAMFGRVIVIFSGEPIVGCHKVLW